MPRRSQVGAWRSLVAHLTGGQGVVGSNPAAPTNLFNRLGYFLKLSNLLFVTNLGPKKLG